MREWTYLTTLDVEALHVFVMERTGARPAPLRDRARLESALMRPQAAAFYRDADLVEQAALLAVGIAQAQAFVDGNKRTAFLAADVFLRLNGWRFAGDPVEMARQLEAVAIHGEGMETAVARFTQWLRGHVRRVRRSRRPGSSKMEPPLRADSS